MSTHALAYRLQEHHERVRMAMEHSKAPATIEAYQSDCRLYQAWCQEHDLIALPAIPETVCLYMAELAPTHKIASMQRKLVAISQAHKLAGYESPCGHISVRTLMAGFRRTKGVKRTKKAPLVAADLKRIFMGFDNPEHPLAVRDRALLLIGFSGAFRRSEIVAMNVEDLRFTDQGLVITLPRSKTDQEGKGREVAIYRGGLMCPVRALQAWLKLANITTGGIWRAVHWSGSIQERILCEEMIAQIVKRHARTVGKNPADFAAHSLRRGFCTAAVLAGANELSIMRTTGHRSIAMVREYVDDANPFANNCSATLGL